jgi:hypothetical protein
MARAINPITKASFLMTVEGINLYWTTFSGVNDSAETGQYAQGTGNRIFKVVGPRSIEDVELTAPYDPEVAQEIEQFWLDYNCAPLTVTIQPVQCDGESSAGAAYILEGAQLQALTVAEADRESGDVATITLKLTVNSWRRG